MSLLCLPAFSRKYCFFFFFRWKRDLWTSTGNINILSVLLILMFLFGFYPWKCIYLGIILLKCTLACTQYHGNHMFSRCYLLSLGCRPTFILYSTPPLNLILVLSLSWILQPFSTRILCSLLKNLQHVLLHTRSIILKLI